MRELPVGDVQVHPATATDPSGYRLLMPSATISAMGLPFTAPEVSPATI